MADTENNEESKTKARAERARERERERAKREKQQAKARKRAEKSNRAAAAHRQKEREKRIKRAGGGNTNRRNVWLLILTTLLVIGSVVMFTPPQEKINQGLDIQGGLSVVLSAQSTNGEDITQDDLEKSRAIIESRVNALGASEATVQVQGTDQILVQIPGLSDTQTALSTIGKTGKLEFARADSFTNQADRDAIENGTYAQQQTVTDDYGNTFVTNKMQYRSVEPGTYTPLITGENIQRVSVDKASETGSDYAVDVTLDAEGTKAFADATRDLAPDHGKIVIILDGEIQSAPAVQSEIDGGQVSITGNYTKEEAQSLQTVLESGSLPVSFHYEQSQVVGPTLGQDALASGLFVAIIGLALVMIYLIAFYRGLGLLTAAAMLVFSIFYLGLLATLSAFGLFSLSLAGVAGIVLTIGMAADSSILVLERFREEIRMGRSVRAASQTGVRHGIQTAIDASLVTMVSALTLFFLASASVKGFGMTLALGIICDILMMLLLKAPLIRVLAPHVIARHPGFWGIKDCEEAAIVYAELTDGSVSPESEMARAGVKASGKDAAAAKANGVQTIKAQEGKADGAKGADGTTQGTKADKREKGQLKPIAHKTYDQLHGRFIKKDINFLGVRKILLTISALLVVCSIAIVGIKGVQFSIEFVGGTSISFHDTGDISIEDMRAACAAAGESDATVQTTNTDGAPGFLIRTSDTSPEGASHSAAQIASTLGLSSDSYEANTVGPDWGAGVIQSSVIALVVSLLLIIAYIGIRFEYKMGLIAIVGLMHDLIIVVGAYALFGREISPTTVAALLTILGYSLYDTVVVFHRINDNIKTGETPKCNFMTMANHSINQVVIRTMNTTLTSLVPVLGMLIFGGETLKGFAFAMTVGLLCGTYSPFAVASPLYAMWKSREPKNRKLIKKYGTEVRLATFAFTFPKADVTKTADSGSASGTSVASHSATESGSDASSTSGSAGGSGSTANQSENSGKGGSAGGADSTTPNTIPRSSSSKKNLRAGKKKR